jgi:hypothetical protein
LGNGDDDQDDEEPGAGEYRVGQDVLSQGQSNGVMPILRLRSSGA